MLRSMLLVCLCLATALGGCKPAKPPAPLAGFRAWEGRAWVAVPGGQVNVAGGVLAVGRELLSIDTRLGPLAVGGVHHSGSAGWRWSFEPSLLDGVFEDASGARHEVGALAPGAVVPGTDWVKLDAQQMKTRGGLVHAFDAAGRLSAIHWSSDPAPFLAFRQGMVGPEVRIVAIEQCTTPTDCEPVYTLEWDGEARLAAVEDRAGRRAELAWDAAGRLAVARDAGDVAAGLPGFRYGYADDLLISLITSDGESVAFEHVGGRLVSAVAQGPGSPTHRFAYRRLGVGRNRTTWTGPTAVQTRIDWDDQRRVTERRLVDLDEVETVEWSGLRPVRRTAPDGTVVAWSWLDGHLESQTPPGGNVRHFLWNPDGVNRLDPKADAPLELRDDLGVMLAVSYDGAGRPVALVDGAGDVTSLGWNGLELASHQTPSGVVHAFEAYGEHGWPTVVRQGGEIVDEPEYDLVGNRLRGLDFSDPTSSAMPGVVERSFDADRHVASLTLVEEEPDGSASTERTLTIERRADGRPLRILRPYGGDTEYGYDTLGRPADRRERVDGIFRTTIYEHDLLGRRTAEEKPNGMRREWSYDAAGRVEAQSALRHGVLESVLTRVFEAGRLASAHDSVRGGSEIFFYDTAGRVERVVYPRGESTEMAYDARGQIAEVSLRLPGGQLLRTLGLEYDAVGRETAVRDGGAGGVALLERSFTAGRLVETRYGNGLVRTYAYAEGTDLWVGAATDASDGSWVGRTTIEGSVFGTFVSATMNVVTSDPLELVPEPPLMSNYLEIETRESMSVIIEDVPRPPGPRLRTADQGLDIYPGDIRYDALGNQLHTWLGWRVGRERRNYYYNAEHNRLLEIEEIVWDGTEYVGQTFRTYAYDEAGYATAVDGTAIVWTAHGRIASVGSAASFVWDAAGRPVSRTVMGEQTETWFGGLLEAPPGGTPDTLDLHEVRIDLAGDDHRYRHLAPKGNVKFVTDPNGLVVAHHLYGPYGRRESWGPDADDARGFAGGHHAAGFIALGARILDPEAGRFLSPDPVESLLDAYAYAWGNPLHLWDPTGLNPQAAPQGPPAAATVLDIMAGALFAVGVVILPYAPPAGAIAGGTLIFMAWMIDSMATAMRDEAARRDAAAGSQPMIAPQISPLPTPTPEVESRCIDGFCFTIRGDDNDPRSGAGAGAGGGGGGGFGFDASASASGCGGAAVGTCGLGPELVLVLPLLLRRRTRWTAGKGEDRRQP